MKGNVGLNGVADALFQRRRQSVIMLLSRQIYCVGALAFASPGGECNIKFVEQITML
jgi:hypothetical protein